ncbi:TPA: carbon-nitrogen hydrolase family protein [bacterium]|nr:carbon-nitrogen hydrolase family protein [bacterium]
MDDWKIGNIINNGDFNKGTVGAMPEGWELIAPNPAIAPVFRLIKDGNNSLLMATGNSRQECFGYARSIVNFEANKTYLMRVRLRFEDMEDLNRHTVNGVFGGFNDGIFEYYKDGEWVIGESRFPSPENPGNCEVRLYFRFSANGKIWWDEVSIQECEPIAPRLAKVAVSWGSENMAFWSKWLDVVGEKKVDIALLPEMFNGKAVKDAESLLDGDTGKLLAQKAKQYGMYVSASYYEKDGDIVLNSAPLFDRNGNLVGKYSKNQLYDPEEDEGATPGVGFPVFNTDFGKVGIIICYDSWFPEPTRLLAYKGAELILFPNAGYYMGLMSARTADNGVCFAVSSLGCPAGIWDSGGAMAGEEMPEPTRSASTIISGFEKDDENHIIIATLDLSRKPSPHWWGGPMRSAPGGRRCRQTLIIPIEDEISKESKRWWKE